ncbi:MAG: type III-B CRISPR module RAMP protein Cmr1, partial [Planctomycetaceae bacterium]|nr:type III-B CRISPR module RAMP protein Cmr1 [Planctomycetaceae bacterium]
MERTFHYEPPKIGDLKSKNPVSTEKYTISVITPLFGGGVVAGENDKKMLIRPMSIRGQLRFWWRATRGKTFSSVSEMRKAEQNIWGSTDTPSKVNVTVKITKKGNSVAYADVKPKDIRDNRDNKLPYVLFPFQENRREGKTAKSGTVNIEFELQCSFPKELEKDVEAAVWAWVNFGGIGARTRRGCGALYCEKLAPKNADGLKQWFNGALQQYGIPQQSAAQAREWSTLGHTFY